MHYTVTLMHPVAHHLAEYLNETLSVSLSLRPWAEATRLPPFLSHRYQFFQAEMFGNPILFVIDEDADEQPPTTIKKHLTQIQAKWGPLVVYVRERVTAYNRNRLIQHRVSFLVPGNQLYIPELAIDLREYFKKPPIKSPTFRPATQAVFIYALLRASNKPLTAGELAPELGYTPMTLSRAFDAIEAAELGQSEMIGRSRHLQLVAPKPEIWMRAQPYLRSPVKHRFYIAPNFKNQLGLHAGLSALEQYSMIAGPMNPTFALSREQWKVYQQQGSIQKHTLRDSDSFEVEVWSYPPRPYRHGESVDPLSLFLSLRANIDERIESAIEHMMKNIPW